MEQILPENWAFMHFAMIFCITCAQMLVVYVLSDSSNPPAGLGLYTVYFMAALLGWIAATLQQGPNPPMAVDVPSVASILNSYILFMAAGQRAAMTRGRLPLGIMCLLACLCVFFLPPADMFLVQIGSASLFFAGTGILCVWRAWTKHNIGDAIIAFAAMMMIVGMPGAAFQQLFADNTAQAQSIAFGVHSSAYALVAIGFLASVLIEYQQHLSHLATEDPLTRLLNRRGLEDALHISLANASRHDLPTAAIAVDIDHFKQVNDSFGHDVGDRVIRQVADFLERMSRGSDVVARTGGEEYLLVLPNTGLDAARVLAERIRAAIGDHPLLVDNQRIPVTVSLGIASAGGEVDLDTLSQEADRALYLAKRGGRNRVASVESKPLHLSTATVKD
ncbi:MAG: GGDEF domain-containing protein [Gammaproteobacteria bacterium]|jgi:diguanylate cyclase (GGDEF)-like protein|nr:GGDEF domain-containing protein [Gammaproteobacteria bacterium]